MFVTSCDAIRTSQATGKKKIDLFSLKHICAQRTKNSYWYRGINKWINRPV